MKENVNISISSGTIIKTLVYICILLGVFYVSDFLIALLVAVVLASAVEPPVKVLRKYGIPRWASVALMFILLIVVIGTIAGIFIPPLADDLTQFIKTLPSILDSVGILGRDSGFKDLSTSLANLPSSISKGQILSMIQSTIFGSAGIFATTTAVIGGMFNLILTLVLAFYLALEERGVHKFLRLLVPRKHEDYAEDLWYRSQKKISLWAQGQLLLSFLVALMVYVTNLSLSLPYAALIAVLAFFGELIPLVGITFASVVALFVAYGLGGLHLFITVAVIYLIISQIESHILYPRVMTKLVGVPSVLVIISLVTGAKLAGIWGVLLAVPTAAIVMEFVSDIEKRKTKEYVRV